MEKSNNEKKKSYYKEGMKLLFDEGENFDNILQVYAEYKDAYATRKNIIDKLHEEIKIIKNRKNKFFL